MYIKQWTILSATVMQGCYGCHTPLRNHDFSWFLSLLPNILKKSSIYYQQNTHTTSKQTFVWVRERWRMPYSHVPFLRLFYSTRAPLQSTSTTTKQSKDYHYQHFYEQADQTAKAEHRKAW
jgi:hypothetical protein